MELILEEQPHLKEYARQRELVGLNVKRRMIKSFRKAGSLSVKQLCRDSKIAQAQSALSKLSASLPGS